ncbi:MAG: NAD(P)-binding domain-containing protein [Clostridiales bacterium]|nr:NAD(P)-binding domain-containing protein [Clostridiales bacterium]
MTIGIIGLGHMGQAFIEGLVKSGVREEDLSVNARTETSMDTVKARWPGVRATPDKGELIARADMIVIAVKPQNAKEALGEMARYDLTGKLIVSFMAGVSISDTHKMLGDAENRLSVIRMMPNLAIASLTGVTGMCPESGVKGMEQAEEVFGKLGFLIPVPEDDLGAVTVCAGSGPAFAAFLMLEYRSACEKLFGSRETSGEVMRRMFENALSMTAGGDMTLENLIDKISTKGGVTEAGVNRLKTAGISALIGECFDAALERIKELDPSK